MILHEVKIAYDKQTGEDNPGKVKETYLVDTATCAAAEQTVINEIKPFIFGESTTSQIRKRNFFDIFRKESAEFFYEARVEIITIEGDKELRKAVNILTQADSIYEAVKELKYGHLKGYDCEIISVKKSPVIDVLKEEDNNINN